MSNHWASRYGRVFHWANRFPSWLIWPRHPRVYRCQGWCARWRGDGISSFHRSIFAMEIVLWWVWVLYNRRMQRDSIR
jgi:hypothetical protein